MSPQARRLPRVALLAAGCAAMFAIAACSSESPTSTDGGGAGDSTEEPGGDSGEESPDHEELLGAGAGVDLPGPATVEYEIPEGFVASEDAYLLHPLHEIHTVEFMLYADAATFESLWVASYLLPDDVSGYSDSDLVDEIDSYSDHIEKENSDEPQWTEFGGPPSVHDYVESENDGGDPIVYNAYYYFENQYMVQVGCQYDEEEDAVKTGCEELISTLAADY